MQIARKTVIMAILMLNYKSSANGSINNSNDIGSHKNNNTLNTSVNIFMAVVVRRVTTKNENHDSNSSNNNNDNDDSNSNSRNNKLPTS